MSLCLSLSTFSHVWFFPSLLSPTFSPQTHAQVPSHKDGSFGYKEAAELIGRDRTVQVNDCESQLELGTEWKLEKFVGKVSWTMCKHAVWSSLSG